MMWTAGLLEGHQAFSGGVCRERCNLVAFLLWREVNATVSDVELLDS